jgi:hypothetical protein
MVVSSRLQRDSLRCDYRLFGIDQREFLERC